LDIANLIRLREQGAFVAVATSPVIIRDLTIDLPVAVDKDKEAHNSIFSCIKTAAGPFCKSIDLISKFSLNNEQESFSYRMTFQHPEQTLKSEAIEEYLKDIRAALTSKFKASFR
jgi:phenylalanyl-tRNA synthetase beta subunit